MPPHATPAASWHPSSPASRFKRRRPGSPRAASLRLRVQVRVLGLAPGLALDAADKEKVAPAGRSVRVGGVARGERGGGAAGRRAEAGAAAAALHADALANLLVHLRLVLETRIRACEGRGGGQQVGGDGDALALPRWAAAEVARRAALLPAPARRGRRGLRFTHRQSSPAPARPGAAVPGHSIAACSAQWRTARRRRETPRAAGGEARDGRRQGGLARWGLARAHARSSAAAVKPDSAPAKKTHDAPRPASRPRELRASRGRERHCAPHASARTTSFILLEVFFFF